MAQLVERTLGKGEVPSSTLGISTTIKKNPASAGFLFFSQQQRKLIDIYYAMTSSVRCRVS